MSKSIPIAVTTGEPAGIGPDVLLQLFSQTTETLPPIVAFADKNLLTQRAAQLNIEFNWIDFCDYKAGSKLPPKTLIIRDVPLAEPVTPGELNSSNADYVLACIRLATQACIDEQCRALVTGPVHKATINKSGTRFSGHTEYLAEITKSEKPTMLFVTPTFKAALITTHIALKDVPSAITSDALTGCIHTVNEGLKKWFKIQKPHILVCGLNPHAGEEGLLGEEEIKTITPTIENLKQENILLDGPASADTAFTKETLDAHDVVIAMYHDQVLPVVKAQGFGKAVNVTLGLPILRTSVDHGTALSLAGTGKADPQSLQYAIALAEQLT